MVVYTNQSACAPIRAEEGITGILCPPNSSKSFRDLPEDHQVGGYPTPAQLAASVVDPPTLDSEGRCVILEFPAFVLFGLYCPATRDETRDDFRLGFLGVLDARIRNLVAMGKRVLLTGDLNISRDELDAANAEASARKQGPTGSDFLSTPARRLFNHLLEGGTVVGDRDEGRQSPVLWDLCRAFHPNRKGMFTCWEQKVNARPGNCGARIDYVLCSLAMKDWFSDSNIQEGLMVRLSDMPLDLVADRAEGSDHCPVYAVIKDKVAIEGEEHYLQDIMNPRGMFCGGKRQREYSMTTDPLPLSGKLIPDFVGRRNIRDMFSRNPSRPPPPGTNLPCDGAEEAVVEVADDGGLLREQHYPTTLQDAFAGTSGTPTSSPSVTGKKRSVPRSKHLKRAKSATGAAAPPVLAKGQQSLKAFFRPKATVSPSVTDPTEGNDISPANITAHFPVPKPLATVAGGCDALRKHGEPSTLVKPADNAPPPKSAQAGMFDSHPADASPPDRLGARSRPRDTVHDPVESKESWSKLFTKPAVPRCEGHYEPCITRLTKKPGMNLGRSFWMCPRPLGPSGAKEKNTQWRCPTFIWCSDWTPNPPSSRFGV